MKTNHKITATFAGVIFMVALGAVALFWVFGQIEESALARRHTFAVTIRAADLLTDLIDAETGQRGFALTGNEAFLEPYLAVRNRVGDQLEELRGLSTFAEARQHLDAVRPLMDAKMTEMARVIKLRRDGDLTAVTAVVSGGEGKKLMDSIRLEIKDFIRIENLELERHEAEFQSSLRRMFGGIVAVSAFVLLLGVLVAYLLYRNNEHRLKNLVHLETQRLLELQTATSEHLRQANDTLQLNEEKLTKLLKEKSEAEEKVRRLNAELEQRVIERTAQLEATNLELESFSYSVSHDLRTPVRAIDGFSQAALEDFGPQLPEEGRRYLQTIRDSAQKMGTLIDDLLAFAQLKRQGLNKRPMNTGDLVRETLDELGAPWPDRQIAVRAGELPASFGDPALLKQVWINLLSNALKYTRKRAKAEIETGCMKVDGTDTFFVRDNGTGFDMRYADKLFGVFQRFHRAEDYEGTGVGLAIVQRIVQRHGGRVWADAAVDRGATFFFTLAKETNP